MQHYRIHVEGAGELDGIYRDVPATSPGFALKRVFDGGFAANLKFASVGPKRATLAKGKKIAVTIERWS